MARANIAATRAVLPHVHPEGIEWPAVRLALTTPGRRLADGQLLADIFEEGWAPILASSHRQVDLWQRADETLGLLPPAHAHPARLPHRVHRRMVGVRLV